MCLHIRLPMFEQIKSLDHRNMLALSPPSFIWPLEDLTSHDLQSGMNREIIETTHSDQSLFHSPPICDEFGKISSEVDGHDTTMAKKLNHNASERDRRKKINSMYCSLRSLLPSTDRDHTKRLSIPSTITRALKYIPDLQREVETLNQKKEDLTLSVDKYREMENLENDQAMTKKRRSEVNESSLDVVWVNKLGNEEVAIQLCTVKRNKSSIRVSEILLTLEEEGLLLLNISCFESFGERVFHNLHLQVQGTQSLNLEMLRKKLLSMYKKR